MNEVIVEENKTIKSSEYVGSFGYYTSEMMEKDIISIILTYNKNKHDIAECKKN